MITVECEYFDGRSSRPHRVTLTAHERSGELTFRAVQTGNGDSGLNAEAVSTAITGAVSGTGSAAIFWRISDVTYELAGDYLEIRNKRGSDEFLKVFDKQFRQYFISMLRHSGQLSVYQRLLNGGPGMMVFFTILIIGLIAAGYFRGIPWVAEKAVDLLPAEYDRYIGDTFADTYLINAEIDSVRSEQLNRFAALFRWENTTPLDLLVVESGQVNAYALPNGRIVIYSALLDKMENYEELAGLIGHEVAHINHRHSMKMLTRNLAGALFISVILSDVNGIMTLISENIHSLQTLTYSRRFEYEADRTGTLLLIRNQVDPEGMLQLFSRLSDEDSSLTVPEFLSTHPYNEERMASIRELIQEKKGKVSENDQARKIAEQLINNLNN